MMNKINKPNLYAMNFYEQEKFQISVCILLCVFVCLMPLNSSDDMKCVKKYGKNMLKMIVLHEA